MKTHPIQTTFTAGEISPRLNSRTDAEFYPASVAECRNFIVTPQGSISKRQGTEYIADIDERNTVRRIETFRRAVGQDYVVEFGDAVVRLITRDGPLSNAPNLIKNADFSSGSAEWVIQEKEPGKPPAPNAGDPYVPGIGTYEWILWNTDTGPLQPRQVAPLFSQFVELQNPSEDCHFTTNLRVGGGGNLTSPHTFNYAIKAGTTMGGTEYLNQNIEIVVPAGNEDVIDIPVDITFNTGGATNMWIQFGANIEQIGPNVLIIVVNSPIYLVNSTDVDPIEFLSPWTAQQVPDVQVAIATGSRMMVFAHENVPPHMLIEADILANDFLFEEMNLDQPAQPYWSDENWPACPCFYEGRLWFGRSAEDQSTLWASESGNYFDFDAEGATDPADPMLFPLATNGRISWLEEAKEIIIMTDVGPYVGTSSGGVITSADFSFNIQFSFGGASIQPTASGRDTVFISTDRGRIRTMYDGGDEANGDVSVDISLSANHLFLDQSDDIEYCQEPNLQLNVLTRGRLSSALFSNEDKLLGWYQQRLAPGLTIESICRTFDVLGTSLWCVVRHDTGAVTIEVLNGTEYLHYLLDSFTVEIIPEDRIIAGLDRFEGETVTIVQIDTSVPTGIVSRPLSSAPKTKSGIGEAEVEGGQITVPPEFSGQIAIGLPYDAHIKLHKMEFGSTTGSAQPTRQRYSYVMARLYESHIPKIMDQRAAELDYHNNQLSSTLSEHVTGDVFADVLGWDGTDSDITISQDLPLNTHITGIFGILATNSK